MIIKIVKKFVKDSEKKMELKNSTRGKYIFEDRSRNQENLCYVLAGYKSYLWDNVFARLMLAETKDIDVCIHSSGIYSERLSEICQKNNWSYLSTKRNNLCLVQNIAISLFEKAKWIYKLDEDMFLPEGYFQRMKEAYEDVEKNSDYNIGVMAPLIPLNSYGTVRILQKLNLLDYYNKYYGDKFGWSVDRNYYRNADVAKFMWGNNGIINHIDALDKKFQKEEVKSFPCPITFNIGAILFQRAFWEEIGRFRVGIEGTGMGTDELRLNTMSNKLSKPLFVSENIVVGHFSFTPQNEQMKEYYLMHAEKFKKQKDDSID